LSIQQNCIVTIEIENITDSFLVDRVDATMLLSEGFEIKVDFVSTNTNHTASELLGKFAELTLSDQANDPQILNGYIDVFTFGELTTDRMREYQIIIVPWFSLLKRNRDCRIFQNQSVPQIVHTIFKRYPFADYDISELHYRYEPRVFCTQFNETDYDFINRLLSESGIHYTFVYRRAGHKMLFTDVSFELPPFEDETLFAYRLNDQPHFYEWSHESTSIPTQVSGRQFNPYNPQFPRAYTAKTETQNPVLYNEDFEHYQYPEPVIGEASQIRLKTSVDKRFNAVMARQKTVQAEGDYLGMLPGMRMTLGRHPRSKEQGHYTLTHVRIQVLPRAELASDHAQAHKRGAYIIQTNITAIPAKAPYPIPERPPRPIIYGIDSGIVSGPVGREIYTDACGRIKVQFPWDRYGQSDANSSCWIPCAQAWSGKGYGSQFIPRVGQEVLIAFEEGNPDCPICRGTVPNATNMMPFSPEETPTQTGFKTHTIDSKDPNDGHMLQFDDVSANPKVALTSSKDMSVTVKGHKSVQVGQESSTVVQQGNYTQQVEGALKIQAKNEVRFVCGSSAIILNENGLVFQANKISIGPKEDYPPPKMINQPSHVVWKHVLDQLGYKPGAGPDGTIVPPNNQTVFARRAP